MAVAGGQNRAVDMRAGLALEQHVQRLADLETVEKTIFDDVHVPPGKVKVLESVHAADPAEFAVLVDVDLLVVRFLHHQAVPDHEVLRRLEADLDARAQHLLDLIVIQA
jgi:hypothetical protein